MALTRPPPLLSWVVRQLKGRLQSTGLPGFKRRSFQKFHYFLRDSFKVPFPTTAGPMMHLGDVAAEISRRLSRLFPAGRRRPAPVFGGAAMFQTDPH